MEVYPLSCDIFCDVFVDGGFTCPFKCVITPELTITYNFLCFPKVVYALNLKGSTGYILKQYSKIVVK